MKYASVWFFLLVGPLILGISLSTALPSQAAKYAASSSVAPSLSTGAAVASVARASHTAAGLLAPAGALLTTLAPEIDKQRAVHRSEYLLALKDLKDNRITDFKARQKKLRDYALAPYLDYHYHNKTISKLSTGQMASFRERFAGYPFTERLRNRWLLKLPGQGRWSDYLANYEPSSSALRRCYHLRSIYRSGKRKAALDQVAPLWLHHKSRPKGCDALFKAWQGAGYLTNDLVWQRLTMALDHNEVTLARYLLKLMQPGKLATAANALYQAHVHPQSKFDPPSHSKDTAENRAILRAGLLRLARKDPEAATTLWGNVKYSHSFTQEQHQSIDARLLIESAKDELYPAANARPSDLPDSALERIAREAVRQQNWHQAAHWITEMSAATRAKAEWQYWARRSAGADLAELATERNYYGFLAAQEVGVDTQLHHQPSSVGSATIAQVSEVPGIERALELHAVDDLINARREWRAAFTTLNPDQQVAAARLAQQHRWLDQAIIAANAARLHNDLDLRFPQEFAKHYGKASSATNIPPSTLLAVTRQESAFQQRARSHANARGLMQLLPATARRTARKAGLRQPSTQDLYEPAVNIRIASEYLAALMTRYDQQRPLAFAAYNAGEHRVDRWIKDRSGMPMEVWIETIPFKETRGYVKAVLAFNHLYSKRRNEEVPLLLPHERVLK